MRLPGTARVRRLAVVVLALVVLTVPLVATLITRSRIERSGVEVSATVLRATTDDGRYLLAFRLPTDVDPEQRAFSAQVDRAAYERAAASKRVTVKVLADRPTAHRVEGEVDRASPWLVTGLADAFVLLVGLWWVRVGRRRPAVRMLAQADLEPAEEAGPGTTTLARQDNDVYEAVGRVTVADDREVVLDVGDRQVVVALGGRDNPVAVGETARARGPLIG